MPAEWEPHRTTWIAWPHHEPDWPGKLESIRWIYADIVRVIAHHEPIFSRDLCEDHARLNQLIAWRCRWTAGWVNSLETVSTMLPPKP